EWFGVYRGERKIGYGHRVTTPTSTGYRIEDDMRLVLAMLGTAQPVHTSLVADTDARLSLRRFRFTLASPAATFTAGGTSDGHRRGGRGGRRTPPRGARRDRRRADAHPPPRADRPADHPPPPPRRESPGTGNALHAGCVEPPHPAGGADHGHGRRLRDHRRRR